MSEDEAIVLAAGKGTRMRSDLPKVLHPLAGKPMLRRVLDGLASAGFHHPTVVVGYGQERIRQTFGDRCRYVDQGDQLGTGHGARAGIQALPGSVRRVLLVHGDESLIPPDAFQRMLDLQQSTGASVVLLTTRVHDTRNFGRVVRDACGRPVALPQECDLTLEQRSLDEVNLGAYVFDADFLRSTLTLLQPHPPKGEYYLTDLVALAAHNAADSSSGRGSSAAIMLTDGEDVMGVNDLVQLERAGQVIYRRTNRRLMESGVTIADSASTFIDDDVEIEPDTVIYPFTVVTGRSRIGGDCRIGPGSHIVASHIGNRCTVLSSTIEEARIADDVRIGPYAHLRPGARIEERVEIGNYAEVKESRLGAGTRMHHMSYIGDSDVGNNVNIGAGAVTCNYDGHRKHRTVIEDEAFIGSDTMLRAPVKVGKGASTGAGSVVTHDVPPGVTVSGVPARPRPRRDRSYQNKAMNSDREEQEAEAKSQ